MKNCLKPVVYVEIFHGELCKPKYDYYNWPSSWAGKVFKITLKSKVGLLCFLEHPAVV